MNVEVGNSVRVLVTVGDGVFARIVLVKSNSAKRVANSASTGSIVFVSFLMKVGFGVSDATRNGVAVGRSCLGNVLIHAEANRIRKREVKREAKRIMGLI